MNNFFFKIENKITLTDILNLLKVSKIDFLNVNKKINNKVENIFKGGLDSIPSSSLSVKIQIMGGKFS